MFFFFFSRMHKARLALYMAMFLLIDYLVIMRPSIRPHIRLSPFLLLPNFVFSWRTSTE
jgi:hypothetical protein